MFFDNVNIISLKNLVENLFSLVGNPLKNFYSGLFRAHIFRIQTTIFF